MLAESYLRRRYQEGMAEGKAEERKRIAAQLLDTLERSNGRGLTREDVERLLNPQNT